MADDKQSEKKGMDMGFVLRTAKPYFERAMARLAKMAAGTEYADEVRGMLDDDTKKWLKRILPGVAGMMNIPRSHLPDGKLWNDLHWLGNEMLDEFVDTLSKYVDKAPDVEKLEEELKELEEKWDRKWKVFNCEVKVGKRGGMHAMCCPQAYSIKHKMDRIDAMKMGLGLESCCAGWFEHEDREAELGLLDGFHRALKDLTLDDDEEFMTWHASLTPGQRQEVAWLIRAITDASEIRMILRMIRKHRTEINRVYNDPELIADPEIDQEEMVREMKEGPQWDEMKGYLEQVIRANISKKPESDLKPAEYVRDVLKKTRRAVCAPDGGFSRGCHSLGKRTGRLRAWAEKLADGR